MGARGWDQTADEIVSERVFPVPPDALFAAFADPSRLARWWGPRGSVNTFHEFDFRPGGRWRFEMRAADGAVYEMRKTFLEIEAPRRIVVDHAQTGHDFTLEMLYEPAPAGTWLVWRARFVDPAALAAVRDAFAAGNEQNFDRLAAEIDNH